MQRRSTGILALVAATAVVLMATIAPAGAHDPVFVTEDQTTPETGPYLPDGTISFAIYGSLLEPGDTRGLEFDLRDGDDLYVQLLIPDLEPEVDLLDGEMPKLELTSPGGTVREITVDRREPFADPFSGTDYVILHELLEPAVPGGRYQIVVTGETPTRFVVAVGQSEEFFTPTQRTGDKPESFQEIAEPLGVWYSTPAGGETVASDSGGVDVDVELIEEELDALAEAEAAEAEAADEAASTTTAATEPEPDEGTEADPDDGAEVIAADDSDSGGDADGGLDWVAPVVIVAAIGVGAALYLRRRSG